MPLPPTPTHAPQENILIVEDEKHLAEGLRFNLEAENYVVRTVETGEEALELLLDKEQPPFDVVVLDVMLPGKDGFTVMQELRHAGQYVPTLMLTARGRSEDILQGFGAGADDYLSKPFELSILIARVRGLLRRKQWAGQTPAAVTPKAPQRDIYVFGDKSINYDQLELRAGEQVYPLTLMEANILRYLIDRAGETVSRKIMLQEVWGLHEDTDTRAIDNFIVRLRRYLEIDPAHPRHLLTVRGVGYRFVPFPEG